MPTVEVINILTHVNMLLPKLSPAQGHIRTGLTNLKLGGSVATILSPLGPDLGEPLLEFALVLALLSFLATLAAWTFLLLATSR